MIHVVAARFQPRRPLLVALGLCAFLSFLRPLSVFSNFAWGVCSLVAYVGWGDLLLRRTRLGVRGLAIRGIVGAAAVVAVGSVLTFARIANAWWMWAIVAVGMSASVTVLTSAYEDFGVRWKNERGTEQSKRWLLALAVGLPAFAMLEGVLSWWLSPYDDLIAYSTFPQQILDIGHFDNPYNWRRVASYGGQAILHAVHLSVGASQHQHLVDRGVLRAMLMLFFLEANRTLTLRVPLGFRVALSAWIFLLPNTAINTASHWSGCVAFLGLYVVQGLLFAANSDDKPQWWLLFIGALMTSFACSLRASNIPAVCVFLGLNGLFWLVSAGSARERTRVLISMAVFALFAGLLLTPWLIQMQRSAGTPWFPFVRGNVRHAFMGTSPTLGASGEFRLLMVALRSDSPFLGWPLAFGSLLFLQPWRNKVVLRHLILAGCVTYGLLVHGFSLSDELNFARYAFGYMTPVWGLSLLYLAERHEGILKERALRFAAVFGLMVACLTIGDTRAQSLSIWRGLRRFVDIDDAYYVKAIYERVQHAQGYVPAGRSIAVMIDDPYALDFKRNPIMNLDTPCALSPAPELPCFESPEVLAKSFLEHGLQHVMFVDGTHSSFMYNRDFWFRRFFAYEEIWRRQSPYYVYLSDTFSSWAEHYPVLYSHDGLVVIDLSQAPH